MSQGSTNLRRWFRAGLSVVLLLLALVLWSQSGRIEGLIAPTETSGKPWVPAKGRLTGSTSEWLHRAQTLQESRGAVPNPRIVFLGDSLTENWRFHGQGTWEQYYAGRQARNLGIWGDKTQHVLWRLKEFPITRFDPAVVVVLIGVNNIQSDPPEDIARGVIAVVENVREQLPRAQILLLGLFPAIRNPQLRPPGIERVNDILEDWSRNSRAGLVFQDVGQALLDDDGWIPEKYLVDEIHLSHQGYRVWAEAMEPALSALLASPPEGPDGLHVDVDGASPAETGVNGVDTPSTSSAALD